MKKAVSIIMCFVLCLSLFCTINVNAATYKWPSTSNIKTYCISTRNDTPVYQTATSTWKYGTIYASDLITIVGYSGANRLKVTYPISGGKTKTGYIAKTSVTNGFINEATDKWVQDKYATVYRRNGGGSTLGSISAGDTVYRVVKSGNYTQVIYPISGGWKMGWMKTSDIKKRGETPSPAPTSSSWQMPMSNAYCTWKSYSNMSWASYTNRSGDRDYHLGIDIYGSNSNVYAAASGKVVACSSSNSGANGRYVIIQHSLSGKTVYSFYAHLASVNVSKGASVSKGAKIAVAGGSGNGSNSYYGTHLHFAVVDTLWSGGGYYGYAPKFSGNKKSYQGVTYYNPVYVVNNNKLP